VAGTGIGEGKAKKSMREVGIDKLTKWRRVPPPSRWSTFCERTRHVAERGNNVGHETDPGSWLASCVAFGPRPRRYPFWRPRVAGVLGCQPVSALQFARARLATRLQLSSALSACFSDEAVGLSSGSWICFTRRAKDRRISSRGWVMGGWRSEFRARAHPRRWQPVGTEFEPEGRAPH